MLRRYLVLALPLAFAVACSKKEPAKDNPAPTPPAGSAAVATGSDTGSGSGSATAGSGSDAGSAAAGSGSGSAMGSDAGSAAAGSGSDAGSGSAAAAGGLAPGEFDKLSHDDKVKFMKTKVMPVMKPAFQKFDPKEYANFNCKTCHGKDAQKNKFKMPTPDLPALDFDALKAGKDKEMAAFMDETVKPEMARLLGEHPMTKEEPTGFGCLDCHTQKKK